MLVLPITLSAAGAAALLNIWIATRVGRVRTSEKILIGDGGSQALTAAMRAHANYVEYTPFVLILIGLIEAAIGSATWLWFVTAIYLVGRIAHALGMTASSAMRLRMIGTIVTMLTLLGLGIYAITVPYLAGAKTTISPDA